MSNDANCFDCDWKGKKEGKSSMGDNIFCERFNSSRVIQEIKNCPGWTRNHRHPNESIAEFESRQTEKRLDVNRYKLAVSAHKLSILAIIIAGCALSVVILKFIFE